MIRYEFPRSLSILAHKLRMQFPCALGDHHGGGIAHNVGDDTGYVQDTANTGQQADGLLRQIDRIEYDSAFLFA